MTKRNALPLLRRVARFWQLLTEPAPQIKGLQRREARLLASFLIFYLLCDLFVFLFALITLPQIFRWTEPHFMLGIGTLAMLLVPYLISRTRYYKVAAYLTLITTTAIIYFASQAHIDVLNYLVIPVLLSTVFFPTRTTALFIGVVLILIGIVPFANRTTSMETIVLGPFAFVLTISLLMVVLARRREIFDAETQSQLLDSEANFRRLFASNPLPMWVYDPDSLAFLRVNEATNRVYGYAASELVGRPITELWFPDEVEQLMRDSVSARRALSLPNQWRHRHKNGFALEVEMTPHVVEFAGMVAVLVVAQDITQRNQAQKHSLDLGIEKERVKILSNFIHDASHDFRTPLMSINLSTYLLKKINDPLEQSRHLQKIEDQVTHMVTTLEEMLTMSRLDSGSSFIFEPVALNRIVQEAFTQVMSTIEAKTITLTYKLDTTISAISVAPDEFGLALLNLALNATEYTPVNGSIVVTTSRSQHWINIEIRDTGPGIPKADLPYIFDRFYRADKTRSRDTGGAGLGLSIARSIIERHQGKIEVESVEGAGSLFRVLLPCHTLPSSA